MAAAPASGPTTPDRVESAEQFSSLMSMVSAVQPEFDRLVREIARAGLTALPTADGVGLAVLEDGRLAHLTETDDFVREIDDAQYAAMRGPCVTAAREHRTVVVPAVLTTDEWPELGDRLAATGVRSALSIPLAVADRLIGTLNVYARRTDAFDAEAAARGEQFASAAAADLQRALVLRQARRAAGRLRAALTTGRTVHRSVGLLVAQDGLEVAEARTQLADVARERGQELASVAEQLWQDRMARVVPAPVQHGPAYRPT